MLYHLFEFLDDMNVPGAGMFHYISFRSALAIIFALLLSTLIGKKVIGLLQKQQIGEEIRDLGLEGADAEKRYTYHGRDYNNFVDIDTCTFVGET